MFTSVISSKLLSGYKCHQTGGAYSTFGYFGYWGMRRSAGWIICPRMGILILYGLWAPARQITTYFHTWLQFESPIERGAPLHSQVAFGDSARVY